MFYRRIVHGLKSPTPSRLGLQLDGLVKDRGPCSSSPGSWMRRQRSGGAGQTAVSLLLLLWDMLGHAGGISGEYALGGSLGQCCKLARCLCCLCPVWTARHAETKHAVNSGEMRDGALQRRRSGGELRFSSRPPPRPPTRRFDPRPPASRLQFG